MADILELASAYLDGEQLSPEEMFAIEQWIHASEQNADHFARLCIESQCLRSHILFKHSSGLAFLDDERVEDHLDFLLGPDRDDDPYAKELMHSLIDEALAERQKHEAEYEANKALAEQQAEDARRRQSELLRPAEADPVRKVIVIPKTIAWLGLAAMFGVMASIVIFFIPSDASDTQVLPETSLQIPEENTANTTPVVAQVRSSVDAQWTGTDPISPELLRQYELITLSEGFAEVIFDDGAAVIIQGPATFVPTGTNGMRLATGSITVTIPETAHGFTVDTPTGLITDYGTEFGVAVGQDGPTLAETFSGRIGFTPIGNGQEVDVSAGAAIAVNTAGRARTVKADPLAFVREEEFAARRDSEKSPYARWLAYSYQLRRMDSLVLYYTFDKTRPNGPIDNLASQYHGRLHGTPYGNVDLIQGRFGPQSQAVDFGRKTWSENWIEVNPEDEDVFDFSGSFSIGLWLKTNHLPVDFRTVLAKGDSAWRAQSGSPSYGAVRGAMQFEVGIPGEALDRLYTDRRIDDGNWHFWLVTYTRGTGASKGFYTLYVDGEQTRKILSNQHLQENDTPVCIGHVGRNKSTDPSVPRQFNGSVDEVLIFTKSLSSEEVRELYEASSTAPKPAQTHLDSPAMHKDEKGLAPSDANHLLPVVTGYVAPTGTVTKWVLAMMHKASSHELDRLYLGSHT